MPAVWMDKRPFFVIGHMVNSLYDVDVFVNSGCNALEADIQFDATGTPTWVYHGIPCDCNRVGTRYARIPEYLDYLRNVTHVDSGKFRGKLRLLFLDLKTSSITWGYHYNAGQLIANLLFEHLWNNVSPLNALNVLLYVESLDARNVFMGALDRFSAHPDSRSWRDCIGFDFGGMAPLKEVDQAFAALGICAHRWAGSGNTNWFAYLEGRYDRLKNIVACRDGRIPGCDFVDKGYAWTLDYESSIAREIKLGLDGVITNYPDSALAALKWPSVARIARLAGPSDSPWTRVRTPH
ncbi:dermonecrotic toxin SdSicTox-betaIIB1aiii-like [Haemaphysalis longicornis]